MPELPEVETVLRVLTPQLKGRKIESVIVEKPVIAHPSVEKFCRTIVGKRFAGGGRRGKFLIFGFDDGDELVVHFRMTGSLILTPSGYPEEKHTHVTITLDVGSQLRFIDPRRFGRMWLIGRDETDVYSGMDKLGPEPFDEKLTADYLRSELSGRKSAIKQRLLDQTVVAGIGNIYSDEILFRAGIDPARPANTLSDGDTENLTAEIPKTLRYYTEKNKTTAEEYLAGKGEDYRNVPYFKVYGRAGKPCLVCGTTLRSRVIGGRTSVYCPNCQK